MAHKKGVGSSKNGRESIRKHRSFVVIAISMQRIYLKTIPHICVYIVLLLKKRLKID